MVSLIYFKRKKRVSLTLFLKMSEHLDLNSFTAKLNNFEQKQSQRPSTTKTKVFFTNLESILPNFDFFVFPIFANKFDHLKEQTLFSYATNTLA
jgi:hypothetical protein